MPAIASILTDIENARKILRAVSGQQVFSSAAREQLRVLAETYFTEVSNLFENKEQFPEIIQADRVFRSIHATSRKHPSKHKCLSLLKEARALLVSLEGAVIAQNSGSSAGTISEADRLIISTLDEICTSAAMAYRQALSDLAAENRYSWRGPATDLREALRETIDTLAPDSEVESAPGYKPEPEAKRPTMKQKVRYVLKSRGTGSAQMATPESAVQGVEELVGGLTRSVYSRSSVSTHTPTSRDEVLRVHSWVRLVLCELLALPL